MAPELFLEIAVVPALRLLPSRMDSPPARAIIVGIALQESKLEHRRQIDGPARGFLQFERAGGVVGVLNHPRSSLWIGLACQALQYPSTVDACYPAIEHNDVLACCFARLLLWTLPGRLPLRTETEEAWRQYLMGWGPGKPHRGSWDAYYAQAWQLVEP